MQSEQAGFAEIHPSHTPSRLLLECLQPGPLVYQTVLTAKKRRGCLTLDTNLSGLYLKKTAVP